MYAHVSREEWLFRGFAIVTILALVGMAMIPAFMAVDGVKIYYTYKLSQDIKNKKWLNAVIDAYKIWSAYRILIWAAGVTNPYVLALMIAIYF